MLTDKYVAGEHGFVVAFGAWSEGSLPLQLAGSVQVVQIQREFCKQSDDGIETIITGCSAL